MKTCGGNVGQAVARQGATTFDWLKQHGIEFDEVYFGKPQADVYIDDNAVRFVGWDKIAADGSSLPESSEQELTERITDQEKVSGTDSQWASGRATRLGDESVPDTFSEPESVPDTFSEPFSEPQR